MLGQCTQVPLTNVCRAVPGSRYQSMLQPFSCPRYFTVMVNGLNVFNVEFGVVSKLPGELHPNSQLNPTEDMLFSSSTSWVRWCSLEDCLTSRVRNGFLFFSGKVHDLNCWLPLGGSRGISPFLAACTTINAVTSRVAALSASFDGRAVSHRR